MKILIAAGGSSHSEQVLRFAAEIVRCVGESPTILSVARRERERPQAEAMLQRAQEALGQQQCVETRLRVGKPAEQIIAEAKEGNYDLVVVGKRTRSTLKARVWGNSTAVEVVEHAACPVIIVKGEARPVGRVLLCESGAFAPSLPARFLQQINGLLQGDEQITILHVMSQITAWPGVPDEQLRADAAELIRLHAPEGNWLSDDLATLVDAKLQAQAKVRYGTVVEEIMAESQENDYDLIAIGAHRDIGWQRVLLEDIAHEIIKLSPRTVLVVR